MIDTIGFRIFLTDEQIQKFSDSSVLNLKKDLKNGQVIYEYFSGDVNIGSYNHTVAYFVNLQRRFIKFEFSLPKYLRKHNLFNYNVSNLRNDLQSFSDSFSSAFDVVLPPIDSWELMRLDICFVYNVGDDLYSYLRLLGKLKFPRKKIYKYDSSIMYVGSAYSVKFYDKNKEFKKHDFKRLLETKGETFAFNLLKKSIGLLRYEVGLRKEALLYWFCKDTGIRKVYLGDLLLEIEYNPDSIKEKLNFYLRKLFKYIDKKVMESEIVLKRLCDYYGMTKGYNLYTFYKDYYSADLNDRIFLEQMYDRSSIYRKKKAIQEAGIGLPDEIEEDNEEIAGNDLIGLNDLYIR